MDEFAKGNTAGGRETTVRRRELVGKGLLEGRDKPRLPALQGEES